MDYFQYLPILNKIYIFICIYIIQYKILDTRFDKDNSLLVECIKNNNSTHAQL